MRRITIIIIVILFIAILIYLLRKAVHNKIYQPKREHIELAAIPYKDLYLHVNNPVGKWSMGPALYSNDEDSIQDERINAWYLHKYPGSKVVLYFHGNSDNISYRQYMIDICDVLNLNLLLVDYRGYGRSDGIVTPEGILEDADTAYNFLIARVNPQRIIIWGESLGGTPALWVAANRKVGCILLLSTFSTLGRLVSKNIKPFMNLLCMDMNKHTNNLRYARDITVPTLICHSKDDDLIPYSHAVDIYQTIRSKNKTLLTIKGKHLSPTFTRNTFRNVIEFVREHDTSKYPEITNRKLDYIINIIKSIAVH